MDERVDDSPPSWKHRILGKDYTSWLQYHHLIDWVVIIVIFVVTTIVNAAVKPYQRYLPLQDPSVTYPVRDDIIPTWLLMVIAFLIPIFVFVCMQIYWRSRHDFHHACLGLCTSLSMTYLITTIVKIMTGRPRPDYNYRTLADARMSFPSGHASFSFCAMVFVSLYLAGKMKVYKYHSGSLVLKALAVFSPLLISTFVAISRTMDYHHDFADIVAGSLLGSGIAIMGYFLWYPSLFSKNPDQPRSHQLKHGTHKDKGTDDSDVLEV